MRVKIVINRTRDPKWPAPSWPALSRLAYAGARAFDELATWSGLITVTVHQAFCGLSGHQDVLLLQRQHMALTCARCGRRTRGWDLTDPTLPAPRPLSPRALELVRRRSS